jgi:hypothetical protein
MRVQILQMAAKSRQRCRTLLVTIERLFNAGSAEVRLLRHELNLTPSFELPGYRLTDADRHQHLPYFNCYKFTFDADEFCSTERAAYWRDHYSHLEMVTSVRCRSQLLSLMSSQAAGSRRNKLMRSGAVNRSCNQNLVSQEGTNVSKHRSC